jgi:hypothetical protein
VLSRWFFDGGEGHQAGRLSMCGIAGLWRFGGGHTQMEARSSILLLALPNLSAAKKCLVSPLVIGFGGCL